MQTIRMQVDMDLGFAQVERNAKLRDDRDKEHREAIEMELITTKARSAAALESLYRKIVSYTIIVSKWGSPNDPQTVRQSTACMEEVFPPKDTGKFIALSDEEKRRFLQDTSKLVLGSRVFQTFGSDLADPSTNFRYEVPRKIDSLAGRITSAIEGLNSLILSYISYLKEDKQSLSDAEKAKRARLTEEQANRQQFLFFYDILNSKLKELTKISDQISSEFDNLVKNLNSIVELTDPNHKSSLVSKTTPYFSALSNIWTSFRITDDQTKDLEILLTRLRKHRDTFVPSIQEANETSVPLEQEKGLKSQEILPKESDVIAGDAQPILIQREGDGEVAFNGFCPVTIVQRRGLLLPGDVVLGSVKWERKYYAFVNKEKRDLFMKDPSYWHNQAVNVARNRPELIALLGLHNEFPDLQAPVIPAKASIPKPRDSKFRDAEVMTVTHPIERFIDPTYSWNQWELMNRKKILKGLENKTSHSVQTDNSHYRRNLQVQTVDYRNKNEQTRIEKGVVMSRQVRYLSGLRGDTIQRAAVITLTLDPLK